MAEVSKPRSADPRAADPRAAFRERTLKLAERYARAEGDAQVRPEHIQQAFVQLVLRTTRNVKHHPSQSFARCALRLLVKALLRLGVPKRHIVRVVPRG